jgi:hypothetical protein
MEMIIALSLFSILLMVALPLLSQAGRNLEFAQAGYNAHLSAQGLMLALREAQNISQEAVDAHAEQLGIEIYTVFIWQANADPVIISSPSAPEISASLHGLSTLAPSQNITVISVIIFNEFEAIAGRAIGVF